jgi:radical SAM-linked protein
VKVRIQFEKRGAIRFTSHKDVVRIFERAFAAAGVPMSFSEGFHPHMRMSFGPPLKTGWESLEEYMDVQLETPMDGMASAVNTKLPDGLRVTQVVPIGDRTPKLAVDIVAVELEAVMETEDVIAAGAPSASGGQRPRRRYRGRDTRAFGPNYSNPQRRHRRARFARSGRHPK